MECTAGSLQGRFVQRILTINSLDIEEDHSLVNQNIAARNSWASVAGNYWAQIKVDVEDLGD